jgi:nucleoid-associated protein YgaU
VNVCGKTKELKMLKNMSKIVMVVLAGMLVSGCASSRQSTQGQTTTTRKIETRFYAEDRPRVDQEMKGNFGYIMGTPQPEDRSDFKNTRRVYVLEVVHNVEEALKMEEVKIEPYVPAPSQKLPPVRQQQERPEWSRPVALPPLDEVRPARTETYEDYVIQEGDTLQKISKNFYGSYSQWTKIYDVNKDVLKDPNRIRAGITIRIPLTGEAPGAPAENLK